MLFFTHYQVKTQIIISNPVFPTVNDSVVIIYNAALGNAGLKGYTGDVYAHTGVITSLSTGPTDWKHAPIWGDNSDKYKLTRIATDLYKLVIKPSIKAYYGIVDNEQVLQLAFVFRSGDKTKEGKTETNGDIFYPVVNDTLIHIQILLPSSKKNIINEGEKIPIYIAFTHADSAQLLINGSVYKTFTNTTEIRDTLSASVKGKTRVSVNVFRGTETASDSFYLFVPSPTIIADLPAHVHDGINYINDSTVTLCIVAPNKYRAFAIGDFNNWEPDSAYQMFQTSDKKRFWITLNHLNPNQEYAYQFIVDDLTIADPYAHKILDPWNDKYILSSVYPNLKPYPEGKTTGIVSVLQTGQKAFNWKYSNPQLPDKTKLFIYELLIRDFHSSHSYQAVIDSIMYLKHLGVNAIELMPIMEFEGNESWGYNPSFYFAPDKYYGTPEKLKQLIDTCHALGIAVILDVVLNHSFGQCPMVQLYWDKANNRPSSESPWYNPVAKHDFNVGYDFNHESIYTRQFASQVLKYWLEEYRIDGYRFDLSKGFTQKNTLGNVSAWGMYDSSRVKTLTAYADTIWSVNPHAYVILEHFAENKEEKALADYGLMLWGNANSPFREGSMGWNEGGKSDFSWTNYKTRGFSEPRVVNYMESHDEERLVYSNLTWGNSSNAFYSPKNNLEIALNRAELCALFFLSIPGPKMIWQFGELGYDYSIEYNGRLGNKPIRWDYYQNPNRYRLYSFYKTMNDFRKKYSVFHTPNFSFNVSGKVKNITLTQEDTSLIIIGNFDVAEQESVINFPNTGWWYDVFNNDSLYISQNQNNIKLLPGEYKMFSSKYLEKVQLVSAPRALNVNISGNTGIGNTIQVNYQYFDVNGDPEGETQFQWYRATGINGSNKTAITGATNPQYTLTEMDRGYYIFAQVTPYAQSGVLLKGLPVVAYVDFATNVINASSEKDILVSPNPFSDVIWVVLKSNHKQPYNLIITDILGKNVFSVRLNSQGTNEIPLSFLPRGIYLISINDFDGKIVLKKKMIKP